MEEYPPKITFSCTSRIVFPTLNLVNPIGMFYQAYDRLFCRSIFMEMVSMDALITKIMNFAQKLVDADRASLFLVDSKTNQLFARIFDIQGGPGSEDQNSRDIAKEIRYYKIFIVKMILTSTFEFLKENPCTKSA